MAGALSKQDLIRRLFIRSHEASSSVIDHLDYNWLTRTLRITFKRGAVYAYQGVPWRVGRQLERASDGAGSVGHIFNSNVRDQFRFKRAA